MDGYLSKTIMESYYFIHLPLSSLSSSVLYSEMSMTEGKLGTGLQVASGCLDKWASSYLIEVLYSFSLSSYADSIDNYFNEEESRFYLPIKEYIGFSESLK